jgi:hypothetical protein
MAWLALTKCSSADLKEPVIFTIVTGPRIDLAIDLIDRMKQLLKYITFQDKNTVLTLQPRSLSSTVWPLDSHYNYYHHPSTADDLPSQT